MSELLRTYTYTKLTASATSHESSSDKLLRGSPSNSRWPNWSTVICLVSHCMRQRKNAACRFHSALINQHWVQDIGRHSAFINVSCVAVDKLRRSDSSSARIDRPFLCFRQTPLGFFVYWVAPPTSPWMWMEIGSWKDP